ncbi:exosortase H [Gilvimarinus sp. DA14]|uniref:exosortase H n=1 Tax=Gilvimarinus sp. DA14 TaxID=2956798 RepID=UPI0020B644DC|nr:exosortase H [Gilvimarinus sp. DA14]UTF59196.1 exosortase H [Gilvimarinus sp. DA14]
MKRFIFLFFFTLMGLFTLELLPWGQTYVVLPLTRALTSVCAFVIELLGRELEVAGIILTDIKTGFAVQIAAGCNGIEAMILLIAAMVAFPASLRYTLSGIAFGVLGLQCLNVLRIVSLFFLGLWNSSAFEWAHLYIWQALIMLDSLLIFLIWIRYNPKAPQRYETAPA